MKASTRAIAAQEVKTGGISSWRARWLRRPECPRRLQAHTDFSDCHRPAEANALHL